MRFQWKVSGFHTHKLYVMFCFFCTVFDSSFFQIFLSGDIDCEQWVVSYFVLFCVHDTVENKVGRYIVHAKRMVFSVSL